jgi:MFS family permease
VAFVHNPAHRNGLPAAGVTMAEVTAITSNVRVRRILVAATLLGLVTVSDSLVYLVLQRRTGLPLGWVPLLYVATPAVFAVAAIPVGLVADRIGKTRMLVVGYTALLGAYAALLGGASSAATASACVALLGIHHAATDGVLPALVSAILPVTQRATGLAAISTGFDLGKLAAAGVFGLLWSVRGMDSAVIVFVAAVLVIIGTGIAWGRRLEIGTP